MKYLTIAEASQKFNLSERSIRNYCAQGRIPGAVLQGKSWLIPIDAAKPQRSNSKDANLDEEAIAYGYELIDFINNSPVSFLAIENAKSELLKNGYVQLFENKPFDIQPGSKVFFIRNDSTLIALNIGKNINESNLCYHIVVSHDDSPCFKIKPECDGKTDIYNKINVETYGGLIHSTWLDRPLGIAGRIIINTENGLETRLISLNDNIVMIPNLCIHFNRDINDGYKYDKATDLQAFIAQELEGSPLRELLSSHLNVNKDDIVNFDLSLYNRESGYLWGRKKEFVSAPRLDDLECVFCSLKAFLNKENDNAVNVLYVADNEEVGSLSRQGADSDFLYQTLRQINEKIGADSQVAFASSFIVSADNAHAVHPNKPSISDADNRPYMNKGIAIKFKGEMFYTSDGLSSAIFQKICENGNAPHQFFANRSDIRGGHTLGSLLLSHVSMMAVDMGLPQLAMHSAFETAGTYDIKHAINAFKEFYSTNIEIEDKKFKIYK